MSDSEEKEKKTSGLNITDVLYDGLKKFSLAGLVYLAGYLHWSVAWPLGFIIIHFIKEQSNKQKEYKRNIAKAVATASEKEVILAKLDDLPAWVFFPDIERAEWLNKIIQQLWPNVNKYTRNLLRDKIQPKVKEKLEKYKLTGFKFEKMILGSIPPRIGGVKVYDKNVSRNEIIMDLDIIYVSDCDINFSITGVKAGLKNFQLHGMMRVVMKPLISSIPLVGGLQVYFLNNPTIDFDLVGVADVLDFPGLGDLLRRIVTEQIASMMVLPNKFPVKLSDEIEAAELIRPEPEGILRVHVVEAKDLMKKDVSLLGKGKSDPYAVITVGAQEFKTKTIPNTVDPKWDYWCELTVMESDGQQLYLHVWDFDDTSDNEGLGRAVIDLENVVKKGQDDMWITLEQAKHGMVHLRFTWLTLSRDYNDLRAALEETQMLRVTSMSTAVLTLYIDSAKNLPQPRSQSKPDPYVLVMVCNTTKQTEVKMRTSDPVWEQGYSFLVANPESDTLYIHIIDQKTESELGRFTKYLNSFTESSGLEVPLQPFSLSNSGPHSKIYLSMHLRILKRHHPEEETPLPDPWDETPLIKRQDSKTSTSSKLKSDDTTIKKSTEDAVQSLVQEREAPKQVQETVEEFIEQSKATFDSTKPSSREFEEGIHHRQPSTTSSAGEAGLGRIQLTLRYSIQRQRLTVVVHRIANIPLRDPSNIPDPYVKLYLLPERAKETKRKTQVVKDNCNPVFDESFEYLISQGGLNTQQLEVTVASQKHILSTGKNVIGQVIIDLSKMNFSQPFTSWFDLLPWTDNDD
ncbi:extended synaptotagmin-2 isoform X2 [Agrilus planipennis]|uniref:Extended synaptotagmin-2 isoform X2 n=1 Tax=Agrilus planipennis TaxID=224129 RepID=A0A1W4WPL9_AGRPL|nr:extended synaptotagmin-2 isoform X2 [Agrilus planipennis]